MAPTDTQGSNTASPSPDGLRITRTMATLLRKFLANPDEPVFGLELMRQRNLPSDSVYPMLATLEKAGWIVGRLEVIDSANDDRRPRRYYTMTSVGAVEGACALEQFTTRRRFPFWKKSSTIGVGQ